MTAPAGTAGSAASGPAWHTLSPQDAAAQQQVDTSRGLSKADVDSRRATYGLNAFAKAEKEPTWKAFLRQYRDLMQLVLLGAAIISFVFVREGGTTILLLGLTVLNAVMGLNQEGKASASVEALQKMMIVETRVRRDGQLLKVPAEELVPGDVVALEAGDRVPADGRIIKSATLEIDESALTGESAPVPKDLAVIEKVDTPLADRTDMAYMNTSVTRGSAELLVTATGMSTEVGHISGLLAATATEKTPLTKQLDKLTGQIVIIAGLALIASIAIGLWRGQPLQTLFITAIAFSVAAIPTGLPAVVTTLLSLGTTELAKAGAIVKRLRSVETLGATSAINSDKTGTLTLNKMTAVELIIPGRRYTVAGQGYETVGQINRVDGAPETDLTPYLLGMALCADAEVRDGGLVGDPTEGALVVLAAKGGIDPGPTRQTYPRVAELPFDAAYKLMATFHRMKDDDGRDVIRAFVKGAPDQLLARSTMVLDVAGKPVPSVGIHERFLEENSKLAARGLRVMSVARRDFDPATFDASGDMLALMQELTLLAMVGIVDPPRPEAKIAIAKAREAGIQIRMITGDHAVTAGAIAKELGIPGRAISGAEFAAMSDDELIKQVDDIGVIARVAPEDKVHLVDILKKKGHIVAMTGDGVNDAPALKKADIGVAMGITGTEVSKEAAVMILTDDNFATIVAAVEKGRALYDNLVKYVRFQMACLFGFIWTFLGSSVLNILAGVPFIPQQTLYVNFTTQVFQAIGLGLGSPSEGLMQRKPRDPEGAVMPLRLAINLAFYGLLMGAGTLGLIQYGVNTYGDEVIARTMGLVAFSFANLFYALCANDVTESAFSRSVFSNAKLMQTTGLSLVAIILCSQLDLLNRFLGTTGLTIEQWVLSIAVGSIVLWVSEIEKIFRRRQAPASAPEPTSTIQPAVQAS
jgi:P-type Ca2+ transporter type 2C